MAPRQVLPETGAVYTYVGEGAANIVFAVDILPGLLLRVPRVKPAGSQPLSYEVQQDFFYQNIVPLMGHENLVRQKFVDIPSTSIINQLNKVLAKSESKRLKKHRDGQVADVRIGLLIDDMRPAAPGDLAIQFKPKWLAQSPTAPLHAKRCRNCAREALRQVKSGMQEDSSRRYICPLELLNCQVDKGYGDSRARYIMRQLASDLLGASPDPDFGNPAHVKLFKWFKTNNLLPMLEQVQVSLDEEGLIMKDNLDEEELDQLSAAMALRDCSCYIRIPASNKPIEARLGDLDKKNASHKLDYWRSTEVELREGGFYTEEENPYQPVLCTLDYWKTKFS